MSIVENIDSLVDWANADICSKIQLKNPPPEDDDNNADDVRYNYGLTTPTAFPLFLPTKDRLPPKVKANIPSVCIQLIDGEDTRKDGKMKIRMSFATWSPGKHGEDIWNPVSDSSTNNDMNIPHGARFEKASGEYIQTCYKRDLEGWRDVWNFVDIARREIRNTDVINDTLQIIHEDGVKYGQFNQDGTPLEFYPFWFAWIEFFVKYSVTRSKKQIEYLL